MRKANKYRVVDGQHPNNGKIIKARPDGLQYVDIETGERYEAGQVEFVPQGHSGFAGIENRRFGIFLYVREYLQLQTFQLGLSFDVITPRDSDNFLDFEIRIAFFGIGIRLVIKKHHVEDNTI